MNRTVFVHISPIRLLVVLGGLLLIVTAVPAVAQAAPQRHPVVGSSGSADLLSFERSEGIGYQVTVEGDDITYRATGVPGGGTETLTGTTRSQAGGVRFAELGQPVQHRVGAVRAVV